jgi:hypothetical protein
VVIKKPVAASESELDATAVKPVKKVVKKKAAVKKPVAKKKAVAKNPASKKDTK